MTSNDQDLARILEPPSAPEGCPSEWMLQRFVTHDLVGEQRSGVSQHVVHCEHCRARVEELDVRDAAFLAEHPFESVEAPIAERAVFLPEEPELPVEVAAWRRWLPAFGGVAVMAVAAMLTMLLLPPMVPLDGGETDPQGNRIKGATSLDALLLRGETVMEVDRGTTLVPGDRIQFRVDTGGYDHVVVIGVDGTGEVAVYQPVEGGTSVPVDPGAGRILDTAFELDAAPGPEIYVAFLTDAPIDAGDAADLVDRWITRGEADDIASRIPHRALGGSVEVLSVDKEVQPR
jgi:hypothetical protein